MGIQVAMARLGTASALSFSPLIAQSWGISAPILTGAIVLLIGFLLFIGYCFMDIDYDKKAYAVHYERQNSQHQNLNHQYESTNSQHKSIDNNSEQNEKFKFRDLLQVLRNPGFWLIALLCVFFYSSIRPFMKFATDLMVSQYGVSKTTAGWIVAIIPYGTIVLTPLFGLLYDRIGKGIQLMLVGCAILTICHIGLAIPGIHHTGFALVIMVFIGISFSLVPSALWPSVPKIVPIKMLGSAYSIIYYIQNIGLALVPLLIGRMNDADPSYTTSMTTFCAFGGAAVIVAFILIAVDKKKGYGLQDANIKS
jgi:predicted MFS family arabinose efflux permease